MTPTIQETLKGIDSALGLAIVDKQAANGFDVSGRGFWNSFAVIWMVAPTWAWIIVRQPAQIAAYAAERGEPFTMPDPFWFLVIESLFYIIAWVLFPMVMMPVCRRMGTASNYIKFIVARNWAGLVMWLALTCPIALLFAMGAIDFNTQQSLALFSFMLQNLYLWYIAKVTLGIGTGMAILIVILDVFLFIFTVVLKTAIYLS